MKSIEKPCPHGFAWNKATPQFDSHVFLWKLAITTYIKYVNIDVEIDPYRSTILVKLPQLVDSHG
jgi:hypothetical protein